MLGFEMNAYTFGIFIHASGRPSGSKRWTSPPCKRRCRAGGYGKLEGMKKRKG